MWNLKRDYTNELANLDRLMMRNNITSDDAKRKISSQLSMKDKCYLADFIIDNSKELCYTYKRIRELINVLEK